MPHIRSEELRRHIVVSLAQINKQVDELKREAERQDVKPHQVRTSLGDWVLNELLVAKVMGLHALTILNTKDD